MAGRLLSSHKAAGRSRALTANTARSKARGQAQARPFRMRILQMAASGEAPLLPGWQRAHTQRAASRQCSGQTGLLHCTRQAASAGVCILPLPLLRCISGASAAAQLCLTPCLPACRPMAQQNLPLASFLQGPSAAQAPAGQVCSLRATQPQSWLQQCTPELREPSHSEPHTSYSTARTALQRG